MVERGKSTREEKFPKSFQKIFSLCVAFISWRKPLNASKYKFPSDSSSSWPLRWRRRRGGLRNSPRVCRANSSKSSSSLTPFTSQPEHDASLKGAGISRGQSVRGSFNSENSGSNVFAKLVRFVRVASMLRSLKIVAPMDECSYSLLGNGEKPSLCTTKNTRLRNIHFFNIYWFLPLPRLSHGLTMIAGTRTPKRSNAKPFAALMLSGDGTPCGGETWSGKPPCSSKVMIHSKLSHCGLFLSMSYIFFTITSVRWKSVGFGRKIALKPVIEQNTHLSSYPMPVVVLATEKRKHPVDRIDLFKVEKSASNNFGMSINNLQRK